MKSTVLVDNLVNRVAASPLLPGRVRRSIYNFCGMNVKSKVLQHSITFYGTNLTVEEGCFINVGCHFDCLNERISIGKKVGIGPRVMFLTSSHELGPPEKRAGQSFHKPVEIGEGCWIGAGSTILPGVKVAAGCVVAAGSVVTGDCEPNGFYAGVPAVRKRDI